MTITRTPSEVQRLHGRAEADYNLTGEPIDRSYYAGITDALAWVMGESVPDDFLALIQRADDEATRTCRYCERGIVNEGGRWIDPEATGDDSVWRETCDSHDTFIAEHEPS